MKTIASAPVKVIIAGEHAVVHGAPAFTMALEPRYAASLEFSESGKPELYLASGIGSVLLGENLEILESTGETALPLIALAKFFAEKHGLKLGKENKRASIRLVSGGAPKGMGSSASVSACISLLLFKLCGEEPRRTGNPNDDELFEAVQAFDEVAHGSGGRPSGIDAMTICAGSIKLKRVFGDGKVCFVFEKISPVFPKGTVLLVIDSFKGERASTGKMVFRVSKNLGFTKIGDDGKEIAKTIGELTLEDKRKLEPFERVFEKIFSECRANGNPVELGKLMLENQKLLEGVGASTPEIEEIIKVCVDNGAFGGKLTGGGGKGGAVIVLCGEEKIDSVARAVEELGFEVFSCKAAEDGARIEATKN
jgi:mevalonate kinase